MSFRDNFLELLPRAADLMKGLSAGQINWRPAEGSWSIAECIAHCNQTNKLYAQAMDGARSDASRQGWATDKRLRLGWLEAAMLWSLEPPCKIKFKAPSQFLPPPSDFEPGALVTGWTETHLLLARIAGECEGLDVKRAKLRSPALPQMKVSLLWALLAMPAHDRRHLWQAERILQAVSARAATLGAG